MFDKLIDEFIKIVVISFFGASMMGILILFFAVFFWIGKKNKRKELNRENKNTLEDKDGSRS